MLTKLYPMLFILSTSQMAQTELEANPPSLFLIKTALHLEKLILQIEIIILHQKQQQKQQKKC